MSRKIEKCTKCSHAMEMYYTLYCPRCFEDKFRELRVVNLIQTLTHLEVVHNITNYKQIMWIKFEHSIRGNDTYFSYCVNKKASRILYGDSNDDILNEYLLSIGLKEDENFLFEVSW